MGIFLIFRLIFHNLPNELVQVFRNELAQVFPYERAQVQENFPDFPDQRS